MPLSTDRWTERKRQTDEAYVGSRFNTSSADADYQRDRARIIHCAALRRLQSKTQVLSVGENDFYRTRLTHSLEVAQLGSGIAAQLAQTQPEFATLLPSAMLIEAICLAHDLGHPPFGHGGEAALNAVMKAHGGFEGNGQTLRIAARLGEYSESHGLDLTRRTLLGLLKYPALHRSMARYPSEPPTAACHLGSGILPTAHKPPKCIHDDEAAELDWILAPFTPADRQRFTTVVFPSDPLQHGRTRHKAFDTSIMELADDIAYGVHDLEDAIALRLISQTEWRSDVLERAATLDWPEPAERQAFEALLQFASEQLFQGTDKPRKHAISRIVSFLVKRIRIEPQQCFAEPLLDLQAVMAPGAAGFVQLLKTLVMRHVIQRPQLQELEFKGQQIAMRLMQVLLEHPYRLLPLELQQLLQHGAPAPRTVCDYVASMTDLEATRHYSRLFAPHAGSFMAA